MQQHSLSVQQEERAARQQAAHMKKMRVRAAQARERRRRIAERQARAEARNDLRRAQVRVEKLWRDYEKALSHPQMKDLEKIGYALHQAIATKRSAERRLAA